MENSIKKLQEIKQMNFPTSVVTIARISNIIPSSIGSCSYYETAYGGTFTLTDEDGYSINCLIFANEEIEIRRNETSYYCFNKYIQENTAFFKKNDYVQVIGKTNHYYKEEKRLQVSNIVIPNQKNPTPNFLIKDKKVAVITTPTGAALGDIKHVFKGIVEIKDDFLITKDKDDSQTTKLSEKIDKLCNKLCSAIEDATNDPEVAYILFCRGGGDNNYTWYVFNEKKLVQSIELAKKKGKCFVTGLGHANQNKTMADNAANIYSTTPTMAAIEVVCDILFGKRWEECVPALVET